MSDTRTPAERAVEIALYGVAQTQTRVIASVWSRLDQQRHLVWGWLHPAGHSHTFGCTCGAADCKHVRVATDDRAMRYSIGGERAWLKRRNAKLDYRAVYAYDETIPYVAHVSDPWIGILLYHHLAIAGMFRSELCSFRRGDYDVRRRLHEAWQQHVANATRLRDAVIGPIIPALGEHYRPPRVEPQTVAVARRAIRLHEDHHGQA